MQKTSWGNFFEIKTRKIFEKNIDKKFGERIEILDIGGGLRIDKTKNNRFNKENFEKYFKYIDKENNSKYNLNYKIMDPVPDYNPDLVGDIHKLPLADESVDAIFCIAVLEHVENPILAVSECKRVLKKGGEAVFYFPFLYYYHAEVGYYKDFWRFTGDTCDYLFGECQVYEKMGVRGRFGTLGRLTGNIWAEKLGNFLDKLIPKKTNQVSGWYVYFQK